MVRTQLFGANSEAAVRGEEIEPLTARSSSRAARRASSAIVTAGAQSSAVIGGLGIELGVGRDVEGAAAAELIEMRRIREVGPEQPVPENLEEGKLEPLRYALDVSALPTQKSGASDKSRIERLQRMSRPHEVVQVILPRVAPDGGAMFSDDGEAAIDVLGTPWRGSVACACLVEGAKKERSPARAGPWCARRGFSRSPTAISNSSWPRRCCGDIPIFLSTRRIRRRSLARPAAEPTELCDESASRRLVGRRHA